MHAGSIFAFLLYIIILVCIGIFSARKSRTASGYILGNRGLSYWVTAISAAASDMSVWLFMGYPMAIFAEGLIQVWTAVGLIFFMFLNWQFVAPKLRRATEHYDSLTLFTYFEKRLGQRALSIRVFGAVFATVFLTIYVSAGVTGMGYLFESIFGLDYVFGCTVSIFAILTYISLGGFTAICYTDFSQGIFLLVVIVLVPVLVLFFPVEHAHNSVALTEALAQPFWPRDFPHLFEALALAFGWGVGYFGQPHILNKFMAIRDPSELNKSKWLGTAWQILALAGAVACGLAASYFFASPPNNPELIFVDMVKALFSPFFAAFVLCAILAATLSTIDSQILVIASVVAEDFYAVVAGRKASDKRILLTSRLSALFACVVALAIALVKISSIFAVVYYCWVGIGSAFGPLVIASLYFKRLNKNAALAGMLVGGTVGAFWITLGSSISAALPGFVAGIATIWIISNIPQAHPTRRQSELDRVQG
ncbi:MAG TPA: sodium/proline symporter [Myxococcota bacterium]|nr:sodium/proline symporter [Myxococcota bacterium]